MKFPIFGGSDDAPSNSAANYAYLGNTDLINWNSSETPRQIPLSDDATVTYFKVMVDTAPGAGTSRAFTIRKNGATSSATLTISDTNTSAEFSGFAAFSAGDLVALESTPTGTPAAPGNIYWYCWMVTAGQWSLIMGGADGGMSATVDNFANPFGSTAFITSGANQDIRVPSNFTLTKSAVALNNAPGTGKSYALSMRLNNTTDVLTATVSDTNKTATATGSQALVYGDAIMLKSHPSGTPTAARVGWCFTCVPSTNGESFTGFGAGTPLSTTVTNYEQPVGVGASMPTTESAAYLKLPACSLKNMTVRVASAPGGATSRIFTLRDNGADSTMAVTISGVNTVGNDVVHTVTHTADQTVGIAASLTSTPAASNGMHVSFVIVTVQTVPSSYGYVY